MFPMYAIIIVKGKKYTKLVDNVDNTLKKRDSAGRFLPGVSGNPGGAVSGPSLSRVLREWFTTHPDDLLAFVEVGIKLALEGKFEYYNLIWNRLDGKLVETHIVDSENPITLVFMPYEEVKRIGNISEPPILGALDTPTLSQYGLDETKALAGTTELVVASPVEIPAHDNSLGPPPGWKRTRVNNNE